jgi:hypothetical protein
MFGAMARIAYARPATLPNSKRQNLHFFVRVRDSYLREGGRCDAVITRSPIFLYGLSANSVESSYSAAAFVVNSEPHTRARPSVRVCVGLVTLVTVWTLLARRDASSITLLELHVNPALSGLYRIDKCP